MVKYSDGNAISSVSLSLGQILWLRSSFVPILLYGLYISISNGRKTTVFHKAFYIFRLEVLFLSFDRLHWSSNFANFIRFTKLKFRNEFLCSNSISITFLFAPTKCFPTQERENELKISFEVYDFWTEIKMVKKLQWKLKRIAPLQEKNCWCFLEFVQLHSCCPLQTIELSVMAPFVY